MASEDEDDDEEADDDLFKGKNLGGGRNFIAAAAAHEDEDPEDDYGDGNFENDAAGNNTGKNSQLKSATDKFQMRMDEDDEDMDISAVVAAGKRASATGASDEEDALQSSMYNELKRKYDTLLSDGRE